MKLVAIAVSSFKCFSNTNFLSSNCLTKHLVNGYNDNKLPYYCHSKEIIQTTNCPVISTKKKYSALVCHTHHLNRPYKTMYIILYSI